MSKKTWAVVAAVALSAGLLVCPRAASGQANTWAGTSLALLIESAEWRSGLFRINASLDADNAGYDSDVLYGYFAEPVRDVTVSVASPTQIFFLLGKKAVIELYDKPQFVFYANTTSERAMNNTLEGRAHLVLNRFYFQGGGSIDSVRQRLSHELDLNVRQRSNQVNGLALWQASQEASLALLYRATRFSYGSVAYQGIELATALNRWEDAFDLISYFQPNSRIRFYVDGQYGRHIFAEAGPASRNTRSYAVLGGFEFIPQTKERRAVPGLHGSLTLGYKRFDVLNPAFSDAGGLAGHVSLSIGLLEKTTGRIFYSRDFQFSAFAGTAHYISLNYGGGITRQLTRKVSLTYDLLFGRSLYPALDPDLGGIPPPGSNQYTNHMVGVDVRTARNLRILLLGTYSTRVVDATGQTRSRIFVGLNLSYGTPKGIVSTPISGLSQ
jgi:hypothetical protein